MEKVFGNTEKSFHNADLTRGVGVAACFHHLCLGFFGQFLQYVLVHLGLGMSVHALATAEILLSLQQSLFDTYRKSPLTPHPCISPYPRLSSLIHSGWCNSIENFIYLLALILIQSNYFGFYSYN